MAIPFASRPEPEIRAASRGSAGDPSSVPETTSDPDGRHSAGSAAARTSRPIESRVDGEMDRTVAGRRRPVYVDSIAGSFGRHPGDLDGPALEAHLRLAADLLHPPECERVRGEPRLEPRRGQRPGERRIRCRPPCLQHRLEIRRQESVPPQISHRILQLRGLGAEATSQGRLRQARAIEDDRDVGGHARVAFERAA